MVTECDIGCLSCQYGFLQCFKHLIRYHLLQHNMNSMIAVTKYARYSANTRIHVVEQSPGNTDATCM